MWGNVSQADGSLSERVNAGIYRFLLLLHGGQGPTVVHGFADSATLTGSTFSPQSVSGVPRHR